MIRTHQQVSSLIDELSRKKAFAFTKLSEALSTDESSDLFDEKLNHYCESLKSIDEAIRYFKQYESILIYSDYAVIVLKQLEDIKAKTLIRVNDLYDLKYKTAPTFTHLNENESSTIKFKKKIKKSEISVPSNFRLLQHVGLNNESNNFEINLSPEDDQSNRIKRLLLELDVPIKMNKKTSDFINNYVKDNGGYERFSLEIKKQQKKPTEKQSQKQQPKALSFYNKCHTLNKQTLLKPTKNETDEIKNENLNDLKSGLPAPPSTLPPPPPPPPPPSLPPPPIPPRPQQTPLIQENYSDIKSTSNEHNYESSFPVPPPPPPPLNMSKLLNASNTSLYSNNNSERNNLLESIRGFQGFKTSSLPRQNSTSSSTNNLNSEVSSSHPDSNSSIIDQLRSELLKRAQFLNDSSDNDNDQNDDIDEW